MEILFLIMVGYVGEEGRVGVLREILLDLGLEGWGDWDLGNWRVKDSLVEMV